MIGAALSGVTFLSVTGNVGLDKWAYLQFVLGNLVGYVVIAQVLLPLYYRMNLTSIYEYLEARFGIEAYKTGAIFFLVSRIIGASLRLYLVAMVLQIAIFDVLGIPFWVTVLISVGLIYVYTFRGGIKTVVWTDTLQTLFMLVGAGVTVYLIGKELNLSWGEIVSQINNNEMSQTFFWDFAPGNNFFKQFISGACISIAMVGLDQDMMQKNLTCRNLQDAQKNIYGFSISFLLANILFLSLGALLYMYGVGEGLLEIVDDPDCKVRIFNPDPKILAMECHPTDKVFAFLSIKFLGPLAGVIFLLAVIAAAYSSADSALTSLTTSFCVDMLNFAKRTDEARKRTTRMLVHLSFAVVLFGVIMIFKAVSNDAVVTEIFKAAGYTYGPLLALFSLGIYSKFQPRAKWIPLVCILAPALTYGINLWTASVGFNIGFMIIIVNAVLTLLLLVAISENGKEQLPNN